MGRLQAREAEPLPIGSRAPGVAARELRPCGSLPCFRHGSRQPLQAARTRVSEDFRALIRRIYSRRQAHAHAILQRCLELLPYYRDLPEPLLTDVRENVLHHIALFFQVTLETGRPLTEQDLERSRQIARQRAMQGVPLGEFLTFYQVGLAMLWHELMDGVGAHAALRAQLLDRVDPVLSNQTQLMTALTEAYVEQRERLSRFREQDLDDFFRLVLAEDTLGSVLEARARTLGVCFEEPRAVALFAPGTASAERSDGVGHEALRRRLARRVAEDRIVVGRSREGFVALLPDPDPELLDEVARALFGEEARVGIGGLASGAEATRRSGEEARRALRIGVLLHQKRHAYRYDDVAVLDLVSAASADARGFARRVLGPLAEPGANPTQLETLRQLARHGFHAKLAASALGVHPNTLSYRVRQLRRRFGIGLDDPEARLRVQLAVLVLDTQRPDGERA